MTSQQRIVVALLALIAVAYAATPVIQHMMRQAKIPCGKLLRTPVDTLEQLQRSEYPESQDTYCFLRCMGILSGVWDDELGLLAGEFYRIDSMDKPEVSFNEIVQTCQSKEDYGENYCRRAFEAIKCIRRHYYESWKQTLHDK